MGRIEANAPVALLANLIGAALILVSLLTEAFNLSAAAMEGAWVLVSAAGLARWAWQRRKRPG